MDKTVYSVGAFSKTERNMEKVRQRTAQRLAEIEANVKQLRGAGDRRADRFTDPPFTTYTPQPRATTAPAIAPAPVKPSPRDAENFAVAKEAFHAYHTGANGYDRGKAFVDFGRAIGIVPATACGITGGQPQADRISKILHAEISFFKYDRDDRINRVPQVHLGDYARPQYQ